MSVRLYQKHVDGTIRNVADNSAPPDWVGPAYIHFHSFITNPNPPFPCYFGVIAENKGLLRYSYLENDEIHRPTELYDGLINYLENYRNIPGKSASVIFVRDNGQEKLEGYESTFWNILQGLHDVDNVPWPQHIPTDPEDPKWEYSLGGAPWFITGHSPLHYRRKSRFTHDGLMMVMQPTANLHGIVGEGMIPEQIRREIRGLLKNYDSISESPNLWRPNDPSVLEWKQYWFSDSNDVNNGKCPLSIRPGRL